jgi:hypothetical protein
VEPLPPTLGCIDCAEFVPLLVCYPLAGLVYRVRDHQHRRIAMDGSWEAQVRNDLSVHIELVLELELGD